MIKKYLKEVNTNEVVGVPMTPSEWIGDVEYIPVSKIRITCGGGMGGASWDEYVEMIEDIPTDKMIKVKRVIDNKELIINPRYIVTSENYEIAHRKLDSCNPHYTMGIYDVYILTEYGHRFVFNNTYDRTL